ncbi:hypothetical protein DYB37_009407 [Aphanomyces astaci]|uniref:Myb/SANT-like domain-containing protein n=1 Tax=Aphanomyces astaci TaxID=112090 RepID=A0A3R7AZY4_APHAT|nr:hypothetical protein DYB37_009407 [Aphanomyces astaci]
MWQSHGLLFPSTANLVDFDWACVSKSRPIGSYCTLQANLQGGFEWWQQQNPIGPVMQTPNKRRLYTEQEDIILLRQVNAERPFEAKKGEVMKVWGLVAKALADHEDFARPQFDAKKAQNRFSTVMDYHVRYNIDLRQNHQPH